MGAKVKRVRQHSDKTKELGYTFHCPGCGHHHMFYTQPWDSGSYVNGEWKKKAGPVWQFNGDMNNPTFSPSLLIYEGKWDDGEISHPRCHLFVRNGQIQYLSDCGHDKAGQTIPMVDIT